MDNRVVITLFRHGITKENLEKRYLGWSDTEITGSASEKLKALSKKLPIYDFYVSSDLIRCRQTAKIIVPHIPGYFTANLREVHFGKWELKTYEDLCNEADYRAWINDPMVKQPPNGESFKDLSKRVMDGWNEVREKVHVAENPRVLIVTHGGVIRLLLMKLTSDERSFWQWQIAHGSGMELTWTAQAWKEGLPCTSLQVVPIMEKSLG